MVRSKAQLLAGGVSLLALTVMAPGVALAQNSFDQDNGVYQAGEHPNIYHITTDTEQGTTWVADDGGAAENIKVYITCAETGPGKGIVGPGPGSFDPRAEEKPPCQRERDSSTSRG